MAHKLIAAAAVFAAFITPVLAAPPPADPMQLAVGQMLAEGQQREANALANAYAQKVRADAAEARVADLLKPKPDPTATALPSSSPRTPPAVLVPQFAPDPTPEPRGDK